MVVESPYKEGCIVTIYKDPETRELPMGEARLREYRSTGLPIILNEASNEFNQETYVIEEWMIDWITVHYRTYIEHPWWFREDRPHKLMRLHKIGV